MKGLRNLDHENQKGFVSILFLIGVSFVTIWFLIPSLAITPSQTLALTIAGIVSTGLVWLVNQKLLPTSWGITDEQGHLHGRWAFAVTILISFIVAVISLWVSKDEDFFQLIHGESLGFDKLYRAGMVVLGTATVVFKFLFPEKLKISQQIPPFTPEEHDAQYHRGQ